MFIIDQFGTTIYNFAICERLYIAPNCAICIKIGEDIKVLGIYATEERAEEEMMHLIQWINNPDALATYAMGVM